jgi:hypothetical protein
MRLLAGGGNGNTFRLVINALLHSYAPTVASSAGSLRRNSDLTVVHDITTWIRRVRTSVSCHLHPSRVLLRIPRPTGSYDGQWMPLLLPEGYQEYGVECVRISKQLFRHRKTCFRIARNLVSTFRLGTHVCLHDGGSPKAFTPCKDAINSRSHRFVQRLSQRVSVIATRADFGRLPFQIPCTWTCACSWKSA